MSDKFGPEDLERLDPKTRARVEALLSEQTRGEKTTGRGNSFFRGVYDWVVVTEPAGGLDESSVASGSPRRSHRVWLVALGLVVVACVTVVVLVSAHNPKHIGTPSAKATTHSSAAGESAGAGAGQSAATHEAPPPASPNQRVKEAQETAHTAAAAQASAENIAATSARVLSEVTDLMTQTDQIASPQLARNPSAADPESLLQQAAAAVAHLSRLERAMQQELTVARAAAEHADSLAATTTDLGVAAADAAAQRAVQAVAGLANQVQTGLGNATSKLNQGREEYATWEAAHAAPQGYLGITYTDPPTDWSVSGCEVVSVLSGTPASETPLIGSSQRLDPVGDVIQTLVDSTDGGTSWPITSCVDFEAAMQYTRAGDEVTIDFQHRVAGFPTGYWVSETATSQLTPSP